MTYTKFTIKNPKNRISTERGIKSNEIYAASYPPHSKKTVYRHEKKERVQDVQTKEALEYIRCVEEKQIEVARTQKKRKLASLWAAAILACGILSLHIFEIKAPTYIESTFGRAVGEIAEIYSRAGTKKNQVPKYVFTTGRKGDTPKKAIPMQVEEGTYIAKAAAEQVIDESNQTSVAETALSVGGAIGMDLTRGKDVMCALNETTIEADVAELAKSEYPIPQIKVGEETQPQVLILHTHGTEAYIDTENGAARSTDTNKNIVRVGKELSYILEAYGIPTIHCDTMHDEISYISSYKNSREAAKQLLQKHPSIKYVIDVHRDAIPSSGGERVKSYTGIAGDECAQVMLVVGTNAGGGNHPNYKTNLTVASHLQSSMQETYPGLARSVNIRNAVFNQDLCEGYFILEVGTDANTLSEALNSVRLFARCFAETVTNDD